MTSIGGYWVRSIYKVAQELSHRIAEIEWIQRHLGKLYEFGAEIFLLWHLAACPTCLLFRISVISK